MLTLKNIHSRIFAECSWLLNLFSERNSYRRLIPNNKLEYPISAGVFIVVSYFILPIEDMCLVKIYRSYVSKISSYVKVKLRLEGVNNLVLELSAKFFIIIIIQKIYLHVTQNHILNILRSSMTNAFLLIRMLFILPRMRKLSGVKYFKNPHFLRKKSAENFCKSTF